MIQSLPAPQCEHAAILRFQLHNVVNRHPRPAIAPRHADRIGPRDIALFHGALDMEKLGLGEKLIIKAIHSPNGDFRDWDAITDWAASIVFSLRPEVAE